MKLNKKWSLTTLLLRQAQLIVGMGVCLTLASVSPVFGDDVSKSQVIPKETCKYHDAWVIITFDETAYDDKLKQALDKLVEAVGEEAVENAVKAVNQLHKDFKGALAHAIIVYECTDEQGKTHQHRYDCDSGEDLAFKPAIANAPTTKDAAKADRETTIKKHCPTEGCCGGKATGTTTPPPAGSGQQGPTSGTGTAPKPEPNLCNLKPPCPECMDDYNKVLDEIKKICDRIDVLMFEIRQLEKEWLAKHNGTPPPTEKDARSDDEIDFWAKVRPLKQELDELEARKKEILKDLQKCEEEKCPKSKQLVLGLPLSNPTGGMLASSTGTLAIVSGAPTAPSTNATVAASLPATSAPSVPAPATDRSLTALAGRPEIFVAGEVASEDRMLVTVRGTDTIEGVVVSAEANGRKTEARTDSKGHAVVDIAAIAGGGTALTLGIVRALDSGGHELAQAPTKITPGVSTVASRPEVPALSSSLLQNGRAVTIPGKNLGLQSQLVVGNRVQETLSASSKELTSFMDAPTLGPQPAYVQNSLGTSPTQTVHVYNFSVTAPQRTLVRGQHVMATAQYEGLPPGSQVEFTNATPTVVNMKVHGATRTQGEHSVYTVTKSAGTIEVELTAKNDGDFAIHWTATPPK